MKKIFLTSLLTIFVFCASNAQETDGKAVNDPVVTNSFWSNWYLQAGLDMTLLNPYGHNFSQVFPKGKTFGFAFAAGKWFSPEISLRGRLKWENGFPLFENGHLEWLAPAGANGKNMDDGGFVAAYVDVLLNLHNVILDYDDSRKWNMLVFPRAGFISNLSLKSSSPMVGVGIGSTYRLNERLSLYADVAYQVMTSEFFGDVAVTGMTVATGSNGYFDFHIGVQWDLGKSKGKFKRLSSY